MSCSTARQAISCSGTTVDWQEEFQANFHFPQRLERLTVVGLLQGRLVPGATVRSVSLVDKHQGYVVLVGGSGVSSTPGCPDQNSEQVNDSAKEIVCSVMTLEVRQLTSV
jgi:hypothetical protein